MKSFRFYKQLDSMDSSPACLRMIAKYYGKSYSLPFQREKCYIDKAGVSLKGISESAELIGLRTVLCNLVDLRHFLMCIYLSQEDNI